MTRDRLSRRDQASSQDLAQGSSDLAGMYRHFSDRLSEFLQCETAEAVWNEDDEDEYDPQLQFGAVLRRAFCCQRRFKAPWGCCTKAEESSEGSDDSEEEDVEEAVE